MNALDLRVGDVVLVEAGDIIPGDGEIIEGVASVNESAITGESAPVIREAGGDRSAVTGGTTVLSDHIKVRITAAPGSTFIDRMIALVEGAERQKTPNELALSILLSGLTLIFLIVCVTLWPLAVYSGTVLSVTVLIALLVCLIPTTIGGLLSAIGIAGMDRLIRFNVIATSGRAVEAAGDVDTLLLDKTGTITFGNRMADEFIAVAGVVGERRWPRRCCWRASPTRRPRAARSSRSPRAATTSRRRTPSQGDDRAVHRADPHFRRRSAGPRAAQGRRRRDPRAVGPRRATTAPAEFIQAVDRIARAGGTPLAVSDNRQLLGVIHLKDIVKPDIRPRFAELRAMGIKTVMVTGDNPLTAAAIASEAGVDDFLAQATPEDKLAYIRREQQGGRLIAMCGDGTNDAPALAQADVGVAMQTGTQAAREAGNMVDLDSDPTKLIEIVGIGKQLLMTRGSLTTFSIANDVAKYFAIIPALFVDDLSRTRRAQRHGAALGQVGDPVGGHLQRADHHRADPAGAEGRRLSPGRRRGAAAPQPRHLRPRRRHRSVRRHQDHRRLDRRLASGLRRPIMLSQIRPAIVLLVLFTAADRPRLSARDHRHRASRCCPVRPTAASLSTRRQAGRLGADRPEFRQPTNISMAAPRRPRRRIPRIPTIPPRRSTRPTTPPIRPAPTSARPRRSCSTA